MSSLAGLRVFVSSTSQDLDEYRAVARNVILDLDWHPRMMEHFGASPDATVDRCRAEVEQCGLVLLLVAFRRGWVPTKAQGGNGAASITWFELQHARDCKIPVLAMLASESWPGNLWEDDAEARAWVSQFRAGLNLPVVFFDSEPVAAKETERLPAFRAKVKEVLLAHQQRLLKERVAQRESTSGIEYFKSTCDALYDGTSIPFISAGIYGAGPLSSGALAQELVDTVVGTLGTSAPAGRDAEFAGQSLATCAEYCERVCGFRQSFLREFSRIVRMQEEQASRSGIQVYRLLAQVPRVRLIVCATFDRLLDRELDKAGRPYVVISHILRSLDPDHDGRVLVLRPGTAPEIRPADKVDVGDTELIVYRPLGAPFLHDLVDPDVELDTVVVTETDHVTFLRRLENQSTRVPTRVSHLLARRPLLFLGYALDVWQYRLMMQVFQSVGPRTAGAVTRAVRVVDTAMEAIAWKRLNADVIRMDPNEFAMRAAMRDRDVEGCAQL